MQHTIPAAATALPTSAVTTFTQMLEQVRYDGAYPTRERAERVLCTVLAALGRQLTGEERADLAARLPREAAEILLAAPHPRTSCPSGWAFVKDLAGETGETLATTRWHVGSVLGVVARLIGRDLLDRVLNRLPAGYAILFGRAELTQAA
ncbi:DUF2267 domain-containing protein [Streptomyces sp. NPDC093260]|uniref:DUF2267 domain-containing protein n=1 Tax=Streptomyces sp. NPDC093260 TaxID=3155073 RepID=UPI00342FBF39